MPTVASTRECYRALLERNAAYEGVFFVGVRTTGVFCRPTCPARKPKYENCEFFSTARQALEAAYRPCKRCRPLAVPGAFSDVVEAIVEAVESSPGTRWSERDIRRFGVDPSTARRQFKKHFGMTFVEYARAKRMGLAMQQIGSGSAVIEAQLEAGYASGSGFREAFAKIIGVSPARAAERPALRTAWLDTPLGAMVAIADERGLYLLEFADRPELERQVERIRKRAGAAVVPGRDAVIDTVQKELERYFAGDLEKFSVPLELPGTPFQQRVWTALREVRYGETLTYSELAACTGNSSSVRAVAAANGANPVSIVVPCHRIIGKNGDLTGYGGGLPRKRWLLRHESKGE